MNGAPFELSALPIEAAAAMMQNAGWDAGAAMLFSEAADGALPIERGSEPWFPAAEWHWASIVTRRGREVRIVAVLATPQRKGAFKRMVSGIIGAGLRPVVVQPLGLMTHILESWGWRRQVVGSGALRKYLWHPPKGWRPKP